MIEYQPLKDGVLLFLPLCPSTNARMRPVRMGRVCRDILTKEAREYINRMSKELFLWKRGYKLEAIDQYTYLDMWFILPRTNCDAHNFCKILFDTLEDGRIFSNDKFILPRIQGVYHDAKNPAVILKLRR